MKTKSLFLCILAFVMLFTCTAQAAVRADTVFRNASTTLGSGKTVTYSAVTYDEKSRIYVYSCDLYQKIDGEWTYVRGLPVPAYVAQNTTSYAWSVGYSSFIGSGTFRLVTTFWADGHQITRTSNERTF